MPREILSAQHPLVKRLVKLREEREYRYACRRVVVSDRKLIQELTPRITIRSLLIEEGSAPPNGTPEELFYTNKQILKKITGLTQSEPIAAEVDMPEESNLMAAHYLLVLDGVCDPGNLGTLLRTAKALGWEGVYLTPGSTDPFNDKALRAAKGASFTLPWKSGSWEALLHLLESKKMTLLAADAKGKDIATCKVAAPLALALGNEARGIESELKKKSQLIAIPMMGRMESLNVATAGAILMYALKAQG